MPKKINNNYQLTFRIPSATFENFDFKYSSDILKTLFIRTLDKCIERKDLLEFLMFDDVDDFSCVRSLKGVL